MLLVLLLRRLLVLLLGLRVELLLRRSLARVARSVLRRLLLLLLRRCLVVVRLLRLVLLLRRSLLLLLLHDRGRDGGHRRGSGSLLSGNDGRRHRSGSSGGRRVDASLMRGVANGASGQTRSLEDDGQAQLAGLLAWAENTQRHAGGASALLPLRLRFDSAFMN